MVYEGKIWVLGGGDEGQHLNSVEIYDPASNSWTTGPSLTNNRLFPATWVIEDRIYLAGGRASQSNYHDSIEVFDSISNQWTLTGSLPENKYSAEVAILNDKLYIIAGRREEEDYSNKVYAADLPCSCDESLFQGRQCDCGGGIVHSWDGGWIGHAWATGTGFFGEDRTGS